MLAGGGLCFANKVYEAESIVNLLRETGELFLMGLKDVLQSILNGSRVGDDDITMDIQKGTNPCLNQLEISSCSKLVFHSFQIIVEQRKLAV